MLPEKGVPSAVVGTVRGWCRDYAAGLDRVTQARSGGCKSSLPKMIINDTISLLFKSAIRIFVISNRNRFRVLFDKIASVYFI